MGQNTDISTTQIIAAVLIFLGFAGFAGYVVSIANEATDAEWARVLVVFTSFEALGFAAAGLLLGRQVSRATLERLKDVEQRNTVLAQEAAASEGARVEIAETTIAQVSAAKAMLATGTAGAMELHGDRGAAHAEAVRLLDDALDIARRSRGA